MGRGARVGRAQHRAMTDTTTLTRAPVPRDRQRDYTEELAASRRAFVEEHTGVGAPPRRPLLASIPAACRATSRTSWAWPRSRSGSPVRSASTASTPRASSSSRWRRPRARSSPATTAGCGCSPRAAACARPWSTSRCSARRCSCSTTRSRPATSASGCASTSTRCGRAAESTTSVGKLQRDPPVRHRAAAVPALQLHDRRRRRPEHVRQGDARRLRVDPGAVPGPPGVHPVGQRRHRQEALADQHDRDPRPPRGGRGGRQEGRRSSASWAWTARSCSGPARSPTPGRSSSAPRTTAPTPPTA